MKSIVLRLMLALVAFTVVPNALAADLDTGNIYVDAAVGKMFGRQTNTGDEGPSNDSTSAWRADGGYRWKLDDARSLGFEVGYMHFGDVANNSDANEFFNGETTASAITAGVNYQYLFGADKAWIFQARLGLMSVKFDEDSAAFNPDGPAITGSSSTSQSGAYFGFGIGRDITQSLSLVLALEYYNAGNTSQFSQQPGLDQGFIGLGAEYRF
jgi:long-subunit fatty acid transport protein